VKNFDYDDLPALGRMAGWIAERLSPGDVLTLEGSLGVGKTELVRRIVGRLGHDASTVSSPTFSLVNFYDGDPRIVHIDLYRIESTVDLEGLDLEELLPIPDGIVMIEWPDIADHLVPRKRVSIRMRLTEEGNRRAEVEGLDESPVTGAQRKASGDGEDLAPSRSDENKQESSRS